MFGKEQEPDKARQEMVQEQLIKRHITDPQVLAAMGRIPRHHFVNDNQQQDAYKDGPLPIGYGQTISQPYIVAYMSQLLALPNSPETVVLEVGTGSGYQTAILSQLAGHVYSIERVRPLAEVARQKLAVLNIANVTIKVGDGGDGWPENAPFDGILVAAAAPRVPRRLTDQLKDGARLIVPVGAPGQQQLLSIERQGDSLVRQQLAPVAFVPLLGKHGWQEK